MTMHLEHPALTRNGKSKRKAQYRSAEAAAVARKNAESWAALKDKWGVEEEAGRQRRRALAAPAMKSYTLSYPPGREPKQQIPSRDTGVGIAARAADKVYTGTAMLGIGQLHKSNAVPVFTQEDAVDIAKMRRG